MCLGKVFKTLLTTVIISASLISLPFQNAEAQIGKKTSPLTVNQRPSLTITNQTGFPVYYDIYQPGFPTSKDLILWNGNYRTHTPQSYGVVIYDRNVCQPGIQVGQTYVSPGRNYQFKMSNYCLISLQ
jgi:hypothetical protein